MSGPTFDEYLAGRTPRTKFWHNVLLNTLVGFALISLYGQYHYLLPWHVEPAPTTIECTPEVTAGIWSSEENVPVRENAAVDLFEGTKHAYSGSTIAELRGVYKDDSEQVGNRSKLDL